MAQDLHQSQVGRGKHADLVDHLNAEFADLSHLERISALYKFFDVSEILLTSSFGGSSLFILDLFSQINKNQNIHFIDTGYHFEETLTYRDQLSKALGMNVVSVLPEPEAHAITSNQQWWIDRPNDCCEVNKVNPLDAITPYFKVWVSGVMAYQTPQRAHFKIFEESGDIIKFHPIIDIDEIVATGLIASLKLPQHPLTLQGYGSIGCKYCTFQGKGREGRWMGSDKTECGLHSYASSILEKEN